MRIPVTVAGEELELECFDTERSAILSGTILKGITYPALDVVDDVRVVVDVGANVGASALWFSLTYPEAIVHALEPGAEPFRLLERNTRARPNVRRHAHGLWSRDVEVPLRGAADDWACATVGATGTDDVDEPSGGAGDEVIRLRSVTSWLDEVGIDRIDVLKIDTEGCEVAILTSIADRLPDVGLLHVEYHSEDDRRAIDRLVEGTHAVADGRVFHLHRGEVTYVARWAYRSDADYRRDEIVVDLDPLG